ncbi:MULTISPECIES: N-formylglutamate amidohydrolase [unclassified Bradyrhizobium]|uniref:N-formylglutamate amidohydrolase n=1 Tax=unclassified Bradyrhizobium TaxID=2631580 RepID=UPI001FFB496C|nr:MULTISPECIES: N-formylglutamate amidohydrolase [unclassified Bradyrhizobium]MCK1297380.1 N-formylglutamate amidohydrolase [Bradyrhizobium sp. 37]MCK1769086.1 N-formylglutamate amidohydrolase [Bradyrhizobium sp. 134]
MQQPRADVLQNPARARVLWSSDPAPVEVVNAEGHADFVLVCEHAGTAIPKHLADLGLPAAEMRRHIAYDIGAEGVARVLAAQIDAPLFLQPYSRLVVDCNRPYNAPDCIPEVSDGTTVPGNLRLSEPDRRQRYAEIHEPFHREVAFLLDRRAAEGIPTTLVAVHSFTPQLAGGSKRAWQLGVLSNRDASFAERFLATFQRRNPTIISAHNEPYLVDDIGDYTIPVHGEARGLPHQLLEIRNDLIGDAEGQCRWAALIAETLIDTKAKDPING